MWVLDKPIMLSNFMDTHHRKTFQNIPVPSNKIEPRKKFYRWWYPWRRIVVLWLELEIPQ